VGRISACYNFDMKIFELGEFSLINMLNKLIHEEGLASTPNLLIDIGDDAAAWQNDSSINMATVDCLVQDVHFKPDKIKWKELGWKALAVSLSDLASMGGAPRYALISLALPEDEEVENIADLYKGILELGQKFDVKIIGGNTSKAPIVFIDSIVFGNAVDSNIMLTRSAAIPGDRIAVTGYLGGAAGGLQIINNDLLFADSINAPLMQALNQPSPRVEEGQILATHGVKCAIDISDGLIADLGHICQSSHVGAIIDTEAIPVHPAVIAAFGRDAFDMAISGGEDYQLLFTAGHDIINNIKNLIECPITIVGEIIADDSCGIILRDNSGNISQPKKTGWNHFGK